MSRRKNYPVCADNLPQLVAHRRLLMATKDVRKRVCNVHKCRAVPRWSRCDRLCGGLPSAQQARSRYERIYRVNLRHGVSRIRSGMRHAVGIHTRRSSLRYSLANALNGSG
jgi:hypothetical protein